MSAVQITAASTVVVSPRQVSCKLDREAALLQLDDGVYYGLNPVGAHIWELLKQPTTVSQLRDHVSNEYALDAETAERDVIELLHSLLDAHLIEILP